MFSTNGNYATYNSTQNMWCAVGKDTNTIAYSTDGLTWSPVKNSTSIFSTQGNAIANNGSLFVAAGGGAN
jgi:hypothetical protein